MTWLRNHVMSSRIPCSFHTRYSVIKSLISLFTVRCTSILIHHICFQSEGTGSIQIYSKMCTRPTALGFWTEFIRNYPFTNCDHLFVSALDLLGNEYQIEVRKIRLSVSRVYNTPSLFHPKYFHPNLSSQIFPYPALIRIVVAIFCDNYFI